MYNQTSYDNLTPVQREAVDMLAYEDLHTVAHKLGVGLATMAEWELQPAFRDAVNSFKENLSENLCREIIFEAHRLFHVYCQLQECLTLNQRIDFLAALSKAVLTAVKHPEKDKIQDVLTELHNATGLSLPEATSDSLAAESALLEDTFGSILDA